MTKQTQTTKKTAPTIPTVADFAATVARPEIAGTVDAIDKAMGPKRKRETCAQIEIRKAQETFGANGENWIKGRLLGSRSDHRKTFRTACLVGGFTLNHELGQGLNEEVFDWAAEHDGDMAVGSPMGQCSAAPYVKLAILELFPKRMPGYRKPHDFNDHHDTTWADVNKVLKLAYKLAAADRSGGCRKTKREAA